MEGTGRALHPPLSKQRSAKSVRSWRGLYKFRDQSYASLHNFLTWSPLLALGVCTRGSFCMCWDVPQPVLTSLIALRGEELL